MTRYISILRGINVGGKRKILTVNLISLYEQLGFSNVQTYIQSGNVVFDDQEENSAKVLETKINQAISETFGFDVPVIVRTNEEMNKSLANNPFLKEKTVDIDRLHLTFLREVPDLEKVEKLMSLQFKPDRVQIIGKDAFIACSGGYSDSRLTNQLFESKLGVSATTRNWKTVMKLYEMAQSK